jgi:hypothetical protein
VIHEGRHAAQDEVRRGFLEAMQTLWP